ncbi:family 78 glycoside hydrolase catalytic domain [Nocardioides sp. MH1]|uniref:family 78 glycoside hydrolase catalytic domain n=1 Tax=Nocardioides sp. MH1 TaxID=3242490 RepID=UPI00351FC574
MLRRFATAVLAASATLVVPLVPAAAADAAPRATTAAVATATDGAPTGLSVNGIAAPVDVEGAPSFGWHDAVTRQSAYQLVVASSRQQAASGTGDVWDSGKVPGADQRGITYAGDALDTQERYYWAVRVWDASDTASAWSEVGQFGTGTDWSGSSPIWAPSAANWTDYTFDTDFTVVANAASVLFHATSATSFYLWQIRSTGAATEANTLKTHTGTTAIDTTDLSQFGLTIANGTTHHLEVEIEGATVRTYIDDVLVRTTTNLTTYTSGGIGFRTGSTEQATFDNVVVKDPTGTVLYSNDFSSDVAEMPTLSASGGKLVVGTSKLDYIAGSWADYTLRADVTVSAAAVGLRFRSDESGNGYMWQFRGADNRIVPHKQTSGTYATLGSAVTLPAGTLAIGKTVTVQISVVGTTIRTTIDGVLVSTVTDASYRRGYVGVRTGNSESGTVDNLTVTDYRTGSSLLASDFSSGSNVFACGTSSGGVLDVPNAANCLIRAATVNWAFLRSDVDLADKEIAWATLYATGANAKTARQYVHKVYVNGDFVGLGPTQPIASETRYDGYDVTGLLHSSRTNTVGALAYTTNTQKFQAQLVVEYADGTRDVFGSGASWTSLDGGAVFPSAGSIGTSYYVAPKENLDARAYPWGWSEPGFDDSAWTAASVKSSLGTLTATPTDKVREELEAPSSVTQLGDGSYVVDFGRTWIGGVHYTVTGASGAQVTLRFGEVRNSDGSVRYATAAGNNYSDTVTLKDGEQTIDTWGARVFRYVQVIGAPQAVTADSLKALALVYPFDEEASTFTASDPDIVSVYDLAKNTIEALNLNFYTDSWTRERTDYEADGYLQQMSTLYLMDDLSLARYSMDYFKNNRTWPTEWPIYIVLAVRDAWRQTGDLSQVADYYETLKTKLPTSWLDPSTGLIGKTSGANGCSSTTDCDIVDWPTSERDGYVFRKYNTVVNALSYRAYRDMAEMATALGKDTEAATYTTYADGIRAALNNRLYDATSGSYDDGLDASLTKTGHASVHASAFALAFGVPTDEQRAAVADFVAAKGMVCSVYCAAFLVQGLYAGDSGQAAEDMLTTGTGVRSWLHMIEQGAGATMEAWDPSLKSNLTYSHPWAASPAFNVPSGLFGIQPTAAGYSTFQIKPQPGDLDWAAITTPTVRGSVGAAFDHGDGGDLRVVASVPGNTRASVSIPTGDTGATTVYVDGAARTVTPADGYLTVKRLATGCHLVTTEAGVVATSRLTDVCQAELATGASVTSSVAPIGGDGWAGAGAELTLTPAYLPEGAVVELRVDDADWSAYTGPVALTEGEHDISYRAVDEGDVVASGRTTAKVDATAPTTTATVTDDQPAIGRTTVELTASDARSGVGSTSYRIDGGDWTLPDGASFVVDGRHLVEYRSVDVAGNVEPTQQVTVGKAAATVSVNEADMAYGLAGTLPVSVSADGFVPTGWVVLTSGGTTVGSGQLVDGSTAARLFAKRLAPGTHDVTVSYLGDGSVAPASATVQVTVTKAAPRIVRTRTVGEYGDATSIPVRVTASGVTPTGTVELTVGDQVLGSGALVDGQASVDVDLSALPPASTAYTVVVHYSGDDLVEAGTRDSVLVVRKATSTVTGTDVTMRAGKVASMHVEVDAGDVVPTGRVVLYSGTTVLGAGTLTDGAATATIGRDKVPAAATPYTVTVRYVGDAFTAPATTTAQLTVDP